MAPIHDQVMQVISPLRSGPDGSYSLTLQLEPQGLGRVVAHMEVAGSQISVHLMAETAEGHSALSSGLHRLGQDLSRPGSPASVQLRSWGDAGGGADQRGTGAGSDPRSVAGTGLRGTVADAMADPDIHPETVPAGPMDSARLLDLQL